MGLNYINQESFEVNKKSFQNVFLLLLVKFSISIFQQSDLCASQIYMQQHISSLPSYNNNI